MSHSTLHMMLIIYEYDEYHIRKLDARETSGKVKLFSGGCEVIQDCSAEVIGEFGIADSARQSQCSDHRRDGDKRVPMSTWLSPIGQLTRNQVDHLLDASRGGTPDLGSLARHFRDECSGAASRFHTFKMGF